MESKNRSGVKLADVLKQWLVDYPGIFLWMEVEQGIHLKEISSQKERVIFYPEVIQWRRKENPEALTDYINLVFENGENGEGRREVILCDVGFAFEPSYTSTGDLAELPPVVCFQDFYRLRGHLDHIYQDASQKVEAVKTLMNCLAILEGAKRIGIDISREEQGLETILNYLETH